MRDSVTIGVSIFTYIDLRFCDVIMIVKSVNSQKLKFFIVGKILLSLVGNILACVKVFHLLPVERHGHGGLHVLVFEYLHV